MADRLVAQPPPPPRPAEAATPLAPQVLPAAVAPATPPGAKTTPEGEDEASKDVYLPLDYTRRSKLTAAEKLLENENYDEAVRLLAGLLLDVRPGRAAPREGEDFFLDGQGGPTLKAEIERRLANLPAAALAAYELHFGAEAKRLLGEGITSGDWDRVAEAARRFPLTSEGQQALFLSARRHFDAGEFLAAAECYERLRRTTTAAKYEPTLSVLLAACWERAGNDRAAAEILTETIARYPRGSVQIGGKSWPLPTSANAASWFGQVLGPRPLRVAAIADEWLVPGGNAMRNAHARGGAPLSRPSWRSLSVYNRSELRLLERNYETLVNRKQVRLPALQALAVRPSDPRMSASSVILARMPRRLLAIDLRTGKLLWQVESPLALRATAGQQRGNFDPEANANPNFESAELAALEERLWEDNIFGSLASDGRQVYAIEDFGVAPRRGVRRFRAGDDDDAEPVFNRLVARSIAEQGRAVWAAGGDEEAAKPTVDAELAGAFFLGPPAIYEGRLYALAELKREIRLVVLDPATGRLVWQQQLLPARIGVEQATLRRKVGAMPSVAEGVAVCPTTAGSVVAIDLPTRSFKWAFRYGAAATGRMSPWGMRNFNIDDGFGDVPSGQRWIETAAVIDSGYVVLTLPEIGELHCLQLLDGRPAWERRVPRHDGLWVAGVHRGVIVLVGRDQVQGLSLAKNGHEQFRVQLAESSGNTSRSLPSGRGFFSGADYLLPVTTGELLQIDVTRGKVVRQRLRDGLPLGNLIAHHGEVVSVGLAGVESFSQLAPLQERIESRLQATPDDAWALRRRGELEYDQGDLTAALATFRRGYEQAAAALRSSTDPADKQRLAAQQAHAGGLWLETLIDLLDRDFAKYQPQLAQAEPLLELLDDRARLDRVVAAGWERQGKRSDAWAIYLQMYDALPPGDSHDATPLRNHSGTWRPADQPDRLTAKHTARRDVWAAARLAELLAGATDAERQAFEKEVAARFRRAEQTDTTAAWRRFHEFFAPHAAAEIARERLVRKLIAEKQWAEAEQRVLPLLTDAQPQRAGFALAALADIYAHADQPEAAAERYDELRARFADVDCGGGRTGRQLADEWSLKRASLPQHVALAKWPAGRVISHVEAEAADRRDHELRVPYQQPLAVRGVRGAAFAPLSLSLDRVSHGLTGVDRWGRPRLEVTLDAAVYKRDPLDAVASHARTSGHLLALSTGRNVHVIDTLSPAKGARGSLWTRVIDEGSVEEAVRPGDDNAWRHTRRVELWGEVRYQATDESGQPIGALGPLTAHGFCFQHDHQLLCVDPLTQRTRWVQNKLPQGCDLWGDDELLFAAPPGGTTAQVFRARDGQSLGERNVPAAAHRMTTRGRDVIVWGNFDGQMRLARVDAGTGKDRWSHTVDATSVASFVDDQSLAVWQPGGRFQIFNLSTGRAEVDTALVSARVLDAAGPESLLAQIVPQSLHVFASRERWIVVTNYNKSTDRSTLGNSHYHWAGGGGPLVSGRIYAINRATGKMEWIRPAEIENFGLLVHQPAELPVLVFVRQYVPKSERPRDTPQDVAQVLCLDKRTGQVAAKVDLPRVPSYSVRIQAQADKRQIKLTFPRKSVTLRFTDQPIPPEPPLALAEYDPYSRSTAAGKAVTGFLQALGNVFGSTDEAAPDRDDGDPFEPPPE